MLGPCAPLLFVVLEFEALLGYCSQIRKYQLSREIYRNWTHRTMADVLDSTERGRELLISSTLDIDSTCFVVSSLRMENRAAWLIQR